MNGPQVSLFNASDLWLTDLLSPEAFDRTLIMNMLFQERVAFHETYFLTSRHLVDHVRRTPNSLFESACREGIIVPTYKRPVSGPFSTVLESWISSSEYTPADLLMTTDNAEAQGRIVRSLDVAFDRGVLRPIVWPSTDHFHVGKAYRRHISALLKEEPPWVSSTDYRNFHLDRIWEGTSAWRRSLAEALDDVVDLRRLTLIKKFAAVLNSDDADGDTAHILLNNMKDPESRLLAEALIRWFTQFYYITLSEALGVGANFPVYDVDEDFAVDSITGQHARMLSGSPDIEVSIELPPFSVLLSMSADDILAVRREYGAEYFTAMARWSNSAGKSSAEDAQRDVAAAVANYAARIGRLADVNMQSQMSATLSPNRTMRGGRDLLNMTRAANSIVKSPVLGLMNDAGSLIVNMIDHFNRRSQPKPGDRVGVRLEIDSQVRVPVVGGSASQ